MKDALKDTFYFSNRHKMGIAFLLLPYLVLLFLAGELARFSGGQNPSLLWVEWGLMVLVQPFFIGRLIKYIHNSVNKAGVDVSISFHEWLNLLTVYALYSLAVLFGMMLLIIPGLYFAMRFGFAEFETLLNGKSPLDSLSHSWQNTKACFWQLAGGSLMIGGSSLALTILVSLTASWGGDLLVSALSSIVSTLFMALMTIFFFRVFDSVTAQELSDSPEC